MSRILYLTLKKVQGAITERTLMALCDSGSTTTMINRRAFPYGVNTMKGRAVRTETTQGTFTHNEQVTLTGMTFPEFGRRRIRDRVVGVFNSPTCRYDIILGRDVLKETGMALCFKNDTITWVDRTIPMKPITYRPPRLNGANQLAPDAIEDEVFNAEIKDRKYEAVTPQEVVDQLTHLTRDQRRKLHKILSKYSTVFDGKLGCHPTAKIHIELRAGSQPHWQKPWYTVPFHRQPPFSKELASLVKDGVLIPIGSSKWGFPTFNIPKKDNCVRWISDFWYRSMRWKVCKRDSAFGKGTTVGRTVPRFLLEQSSGCELRGTIRVFCKTHQEHQTVQQHIDFD